MRHRRTLLLVACFSALYLGGVDRTNGALIALDPPGLGGTINQLTFSVGGGPVETFEFDNSLALSIDPSTTLTLNLPNAMAGGGVLTFPTRFDFWLTDETHTEIPGTRHSDIIDSPNGGAMSGFTPNQGGLVVFHDFHFEFSPNPNNSNITQWAAGQATLSFSQSAEVVPEPASLVALSSLGLFGLGLAYRRRRRSKE